MTPAQATAEVLVRAVDLGSSALRSVVRDVPVHAVPTVLEALARALNECRAALTEAPTLVDWSPGDARKAHARYARGLRDAWTVTGERSYQRAKKRRHARTGTKEFDGGVCHASGVDQRPERRAG